MALTKFTIAPNQAGYTAKDGKETLYVKLDGGAGRFRSDVLNSASMVNVQWTFNKEEYRYFRAFYNSVTQSGALPFLIDLILDSDELTEHEARFMPDSISVGNIVATQNFTVSAMLEVTPIVQDAEYVISLFVAPIAPPDPQFLEYGEGVFQPARPHLWWEELDHPEFATA